MGAALAVSGAGTWLYEVYIQERRLGIEPSMHWRRPELRIWVDNRSRFQIFREHARSASFSAHPSHHRTSLVVLDAVHDVNLPDNSNTKVPKT